MSDQIIFQSENGKEFLDDAFPILPELELAVAIQACKDSGAANAAAALSKHITRAQIELAHLAAAYEARGAELERVKGELAKQKPMASLGQMMFDITRAICEAGEHGADRDATKDELVNAYIDTWKDQRREIEQLQSELNYSRADSQLLREELDGMEAELTRLRDCERALAVMERHGLTAECWPAAAGGYEWEVCMLTGELVSGRSRHGTASVALLAAGESFKSQEPTP